MNRKIKLVTIILSTVLIVSSAAFVLADFSRSQLYYKRHLPEVTPPPRIADPIVLSEETLNLPDPVTRDTCYSITVKLENLDDNYTVDGEFTIAVYCDGEEIHDNMITMEYWWEGEGYEENDYLTFTSNSIDTALYATIPFFMHRRNAEGYKPQYVTFEIYFNTIAIAGDWSIEFTADSI